MNCLVVTMFVEQPLALSGLLIIAISEQAEGETRELFKQARGCAWSMKEGLQVSHKQLALANF